MISLGDEIAAAAQTLHLAPGTFRLVEGDEHSHILDTVIRRYVRQPNVRWWWEAFRGRCVSVSIVAPIWSDWLSRFVESPQDLRIWFIAGVDDDDPILYETTIAIAESVLLECYGFEYYFAAHDLSWLVGETDDGTCFVLGFRLLRRLRAYMRDHPDEVSKYYVWPRRT